MFECCINSIKGSDILIAILEGPDVDSGTCIELGYAFANDIPIIGVRTDLRGLEEKGVNLMVSKVCSKYIYHPNKNASFELLIAEILNAIHNLGTVKTR